MQTYLVAKIDICGSAAGRRQRRHGILAFFLLVDPLFSNVKIIFPSMNSNQNNLFLWDFQPQIIMVHVFKKKFNPKTTKKARRIYVYRKDVTHRIRK